MSPSVCQNCGWPVPPEPPAPEPSTYSASTFHGDPVDSRIDDYRRLVETLREHLAGADAEVKEARAEVARLNAQAADDLEYIEGLREPPEDWTDPGDKFREGYLEALRNVLAGLKVEAGRAMLADVSRLRSENQSMRNALLAIADSAEAWAAAKDEPFSDRFLLNLAKQARQSTETTPPGGENTNG